MAKFRQENLEAWQAPYETNVKKLAKDHPIANVIGLGMPALAQSAAGGVGNAVSIMATPDKRPAAKRIGDAIEGSNLVSGIKQVATPPPAGQTSIALTPKQAEASVPPIGANSQSMTPMASHTPATGPINIAPMRKPLPITAEVSPEIAAGQGGQQPAETTQGSGFAIVDGKRIDLQDIGGANDPLKKQGGYVMPGNGSVTVMPSSQVAPIGGDKWSFLEDGSAFGTAKAGVARKLGYVPLDYDRNPEKYDQLLAAQGAQFAHAENQIPVAEIGAGADRYKADQGLAGERLKSEAEVKAAEIGAGAKANENKSAAQLKLMEKQEKEQGEAQKFLTDRSDYWRKFMADNPGEVESGMAKYAQSLGKAPEDLTDQDKNAIMETLIRSRVMDDLRQRGSGSRESQIALLQGKLRQAQALLKSQAPGKDNITQEVINLKNQLKQLQGGKA